MKRLEGKVALVTGAARGIGYGIATKLAENGATVVICDIMEDVVAESAKQLAAETGAKVDYVVANVADSASVDAMIATVIERYGQLHILVNNAGINRDGMLHKMTNENWDAVIAVDLSSVFYCTRAAAIHMREKGYGRIINIASASVNGNVGQANYSAAKAGVIGLTKTTAKELGRKGITCNAVIPGFIDTAMLRGVPENVLEEFMKKIWLGRLGTIEDVGNAVTFLASDEASYITASTIDVTGGAVL